jgi:hypothetical protein
MNKVAGLEGEDAVDITIGGLISGRTEKEFSRKAAEKEMREKLFSVSKALKYEPPEELAQLQQLYSETAGGLRETGQEIQDIAQSRAGMYSYGAGRYKQALREGAASTISDVTRVGGANVSSQAIAGKLGVQQMQGMRDIAMQNQLFRDQASSDYMQSLQERIGIEQQASQFDVAGLQAGISEADKVYQSKLDRVRMWQQLEITLAGNVLNR